MRLPLLFAGAVFCAKNLLPHLAYPRFAFLSGRMPQEQRCAKMNHSEERFL